MAASHVSKPDADAPPAAVESSAEAPETTAKLRPKFTMRRRRSGAKSSGNVSTPEDLSTRADDVLQAGDPGVDVIIPVSKPRKAMGWRMLRMLTAKMFKCGSPTRMYEGYLEKLYLAAGLVQREVELDFETTLQCWAPAKPQRRPPLVLLHGFGSTSTSQWDGQVTELGANFELYIPNLVFFGRSFTTSEKRSMGFQAECIAKLMQHFEVQRYDIIGFSYGAAIAHRLAAKYPKKVRRVVIADEGIMMNRKDLEEMQKELNIDDGHGFWKLPNSADDVRKLEEIAFEKPMSLPNFLYKDVLQTMFSRHQEQWKELIHEYTVDRPDDPSKNAVLEHVRGRVFQEVLLIWGQYDFMAPLRFGKQLKSHFGDKCRLAVLRKARHMAHAQHPREFNHLVCDFLLSSDASVHSGKYSTVIADEEDVVSEADSVEQVFLMDTNATIAVPEDVKEETETEMETGTGTETEKATVQETAVILTGSDVEQVVSTPVLEDVKEETETEMETETGTETEKAIMKETAVILTGSDVEQVVSTPVLEDVKETETEMETETGTETEKAIMKETAVILTSSDVEQVVLTTVLEDVKEETEPETEMSTMEKTAVMLTQPDGDANEKGVEVVMITQENELNEIGKNVKDKNVEISKEVSEKELEVLEEYVVEAPREEYKRIVVVNVVDATEGEKREDNIAALESEYSSEKIEEVESKRTEGEPESDASQKAASTVEFLCGPVLFSSKIEETSVYVMEPEELELANNFLEAGRDSGNEGKEDVECCIDTRPDEVKCEAEEKVVEVAVSEENVETAFVEDVVVIKKKEETVGNHGMDNFVVENDISESSSDAKKELEGVLKSEREEVTILDTKNPEKETLVLESDGMQGPIKDHMDAELILEAKQREKHRLELERKLERQYRDRRSLSFSESDW